MEKIVLKLSDVRKDLEQWADICYCTSARYQMLTDIIAEPPTLTSVLLGLLSTGQYDFHHWE